ncbi:MAG TPA: glycosyltransferase family A protein, partial [Thermoleophilaceae bacterium]
MISLGDEPGLVSAVRSLLGQDEPVEVVLVNTGGGDASGTLRAAGLDVPLVHREQRHYPGGARNLGLEATSAPLVSFLAADCVAMPGWAAGRLRRHLAGAAAVSSAMVSAYPLSAAAQTAHMLMFHTRMPTAPAEGRKLYSVSYARELFERHGRFREDLRTGEDTDFNGRLDVPIEWAPEVQTAHRHPTRATALFAEHFARGRRTPAVLDLLQGQPSRREVALHALVNVQRCVRSTWRGSSRAGRRALVRGWPLLVPATAAFCAGLLTARGSAPATGPAAPSPPARPAAPPGSERNIDAYGLKVAVRGDWPEVLEAIALDFAFFETAAPANRPDLEILVERRPPDYERFAELPAAFVTPRNVVFKDGERTVVDYFGRALSVVDRANGRVTVQGQDAHLVHEAAYLYLLSHIGQHVESLGFMRLHAVGLVGRAGAVAVMIPSGGGKSTLAVRALKEDGVRLLSDDSPLLDRRGRLHPFMLRIGVNPTDAASLPEGDVRRIERMEFDAKLALDLASFADRVERRAQPLRHLVIARPGLGSHPRLEPMSRA